MGQEIERKFLVDPAKFLEVVVTIDQPTVFITQGYLQEKPVIRVRRVIPEYKGYLTIKGEGLLTREETEVEIPYQLACTLYDLCKLTIQKTRTKIKHADHIWEVDYFPKLRLYLAEIELKTEDESFELPPWVTTEVTQNVEYTNVFLAKREALK